MQISKKSIRYFASLIMCAILLSACASDGTNNNSNGRGDKANKNQALHPIISAKECTDKGGELIGDIGDGRIHRPDYLCNNGTAPIGTIKNQDEPVMTEGAVCCGP